jgi:hypothetical protein
MASDVSEQRRLAESRLKRACDLSAVDTTDPNAPIPVGAVMADPQKLSHNNTYGSLPRFYVDKVVQCHQCGTEEVSPAERQKWWYEEAKGNINTQAVLCRACRHAKRQRKK